MPKNSVPKLFRSAEELGTSEMSQINGKSVKHTYQLTLLVSQIMIV